MLGALARLRAAAAARCRPPSTSSSSSSPARQPRGSSSASSLGLPLELAASYRVSLIPRPSARSTTAQRWLLELAASRAVSCHRR